MNFLHVMIVAVAISLTACNYFNSSQPTGSLNASVPSSNTKVQKIDVPINGIFSFGMGIKFPESSTQQLDYIAGMSTVFNWEDMEPWEGKYDFSEIDKHLMWASKNNKLLNICLYAGNKTPSWLSSKGVPMIQLKRRLREDQAKMDNAVDQTVQAPIFWNATYLTYWKKFVSALADRYRDNVSVGYVSITGPTPKDLSTGTVIRYDEDWQKIVEAGYTHEKHVAAWRDMINYFVKEFPNKPVVLAMCPLRPGGADLRLDIDLVDYVIEKKFSNVHFLAVTLNDAWFKSNSVFAEFRNLFKKAKTNGHSFGYQMVYAVDKMDQYQSSKNRLVTDMGKTLQLAIDDGASWIEVWHDDIIYAKDSKLKRSPKEELSNSNKVKQRPIEETLNLKYKEQIKEAHQQLLKQN